MRAWLALAALVVLALALRVPLLESLPTPCGDEGNWAWFGRELAAGRPAALAPDARFVTLAFARLIALCHKAFGVSWTSTRAPLVAGVVLGMVSSFGFARRAGLPRAGLVVAAVLAVHPWSVLWSRTATVPYALALVLAVTGTLALLAARGRTSAPPWIAVGALLGTGLHFTPLALLPLAVGACWLVAHHRPLARTRGPWLALGAALLVAAPVFVGAVDVARVGSTRPRHLFTNLGDRLAVYFRTLLGTLGGDATLRHFVGPRPSVVLETLTLSACAAILYVASRPRANDPPAARDLAALARWGTLVALAGTAVLLAPARPWNLPAIDAERYGFVLVGPFALALGALAERPRWCAVPWVVCALLLAGPTRASLVGLYRGAGADHGFWTLAGGGGYRGWKTAATDRALPDAIARAVHARRGGAPATVVVADYAFHALPFATGDAPVETIDVAKRALPRAPGRVHVFVRWSDGLFGPGYTPRDEVAANAALTALMRSDRFTDLRPLARFAQRDGAPLVEIWAAHHVR